MLTIGIRFVHETIRAASPDDTVMTGDRPVGEWPPSPARLFSALVAADGTGVRCRVTTGEELRILEGLPAPTILASELESVATTELPSRFVVRDERHNGITQEYVARSNTLVHPGVRMSPKVPQVFYIWDSDLDSTTVDALRRRAARIGYLGASDSPVVCSVSTEPPDSDLPVWQVSGEGTTTLPVPYEGFTEQLDLAFGEWSAGRPSRRAWIRTERARYGRRPADGELARPTVLWFRFDRALHGRKALQLSELVRRTVLARYQRFVLEDDEPAVPWVLHGHDIPADVRQPYQLARYLPLTNVGYRRSDGRIHGCAVWLPGSTRPEIVEGVRQALWGWKRLTNNSIDVGVDPYLGELRPWSAVPTRWTGPSPFWRSATPIVADSGVKKGGPTLQQIQQWFVNAGHVAPLRARVSAVPALSGATRLRPSEVHHRRGVSAYPYFWVDVAFDEPQDGPLCVGRGRHLGIGLLAPVTARTGRMAASLGDPS